MGLSFSRVCSLLSCERGYEGCERTWQDETEGGRLEKEWLSFAEGHGNTDGAHRHHGQTEEGHDGWSKIQIYEGGGWEEAVQKEMWEQ